MPWLTGEILKFEIAECPECECKIPFYKTAQLGHIVYCPECLARLEIDWLDPLQLNSAEHDDCEEWAGDP